MILENRDTKNKCKLYTGENIFKYVKWKKMNHLLKTKKEYKNLKK